MERTHVASIYRPGVSSDARLADAETWTLVASGVDCNIQGKRGTVRQSAEGKRVESDRTGFFPDGTDILEGDGVEVTSGAGPARFLVRFADPLGAGWDTETDLAQTDKAFT